MGDSIRSVSGSLPLGRLVEDALRQLEQLGYSRRSLHRYRTIWEHLTEFSYRKQLGDSLSDSLTARFVAEYRVGDGEGDKPGQRWRRHIVWGVRVLRGFADHGCIERFRANMKAFHVLPAMKGILRDYEQYCKERLILRPSTLQRRIRELTVFLDFLRRRSVKTLDQIRAVDLSEFVSSRNHLEPKTVSRSTRTSVLSFQRSEFPGMLTFHRYGTPSSSKSFSEQSIAAQSKGKETMPFFCWHADWGFVPGTFAHCNWTTSTGTNRESRSRNRKRTHR